MEVRWEAGGGALPLISFCVSKSGSTVNLITASSIMGNWFKF